MQRYEVRWWRIPMPPHESFPVCWTDSQKVAEEIGEVLLTQPNCTGVSIRENLDDGTQCGLGSRLKSSWSE